MKSAPVDGEHELFGFLTTEGYAGHPATQGEVDLSVESETIEALNLQRPLPDETLRIVARARKKILLPLS